MVVAIFWISLLVVCEVAAILDVVINKLNPYPKMKDVGEERIFPLTICKTRKMYELEKR